MVRNRVPSWLVGLLMLAINTVCASGDEKLRVVTSTTDLASLVQKIGGDRVAVTSLSHGYQDPHFAPVNARSLLNLNRADLFLVIGLQMELAWLGEGLSELSPIAQCRNPRIQSGSLGYFDVSPYVQVVERPDEITRAQGILYPSVRSNRYQGYPTDTHTSALSREMKRQIVRVILVEPCYEFRNPGRIATDTGARVLVVPGSVGGVEKATDYFSLLEYDIESLVTSFQLLSGGHHR